MVYRSTSFGFVTLSEGNSPAMCSEGTGGLRGQILGSLGGEWKVVLYERRHVIFSAAFHGGTSHSGEDKVKVTLPERL